MNTELLSALAVSLALTIALEAAFYWLSGRRDKMDLLLLVLVNILTNPVVVLLYYLSAAHTSWNTYAVQITLEALAVLVEGYCFKKYGQAFRRPYLFAAAANVFSYGVGILIKRLW